MKAIVLGAGRGFDRGQGTSVPKCLLEGIAGWRVLDWLINALREGAEVDDIVFVAGDGMRRVQEAYPQLRYVHNPSWSEQHVLGSLFSAESELRGPLYFSYADIVYRPDVVSRLRNTEGDIVLVVDRNWRTRYVGRNPQRLADAEKVVVRDGRVTWIGKDLPLDSDIAGEFIGLARFSERGTAWLRQTYASLVPTYRNRPYRGHRNLANGNLTDLLQELVEQGLTIRVVEIDGDYAELDVASDLQHFVFGTKAETLERLRPMLTRAQVTDGLHIRVGEWRENPQAVATELVNRFGGEPLAIRSSAQAEDSITESAAGRYRSVIGVAGNDISAITAAVEEVVASYDKGTKCSDDQILVQPCLTDVAMSGVMMTRDLDTGAEYLVVNYDAESGRTDRVTAGSGGTTETIKIQRGCQRKIADRRIGALVEVAEELESITGSDALDMEFAFTRDETLHVLQVRPIARRAAWTPVDPHTHAQTLASVRDFLIERLGPVPGVLGRRTIFGQMPDWNPAEMIGPFPHRLARTLYELLITDSTWREARGALGYADPFPHALMVNIAGRPFVDVRLSANNLLPSTLAPEIRARVIDAGIEHLRTHPELHDKIEFEVFPTAWHLHMQPRYDDLIAAGLPCEDIGEVDARVCQHTRDLVIGGVARVRELLATTESLEQHTQLLLEDDGSPLARVKQLLDRTILEGTRPFSALARLAFVGTSILRSLRAEGLIRESELVGFTASVRTISSEMVDALANVRDGQQSLEDFLDRFGHLRPGTYDLLSVRYDQDPHLYFGDLSRITTPSNDHDSIRPWNDATHARIDQRLRESGLALDADTVCAFARAAIAGRELAKFRFTRALSAALELIADFGVSEGLSREELVHLDIKNLLESTNSPEGPQRSDELRRIIARTRLLRGQQEKILLPGLIMAPEDLELVRPPASRPNFVTSGRVHAEILRFDTAGDDAVDIASAVDGDGLAGRIVLLEGADPGYDWIFTHGISGLITRYGGANSHMTIRCAEFGLPAAIGCGDALYEQLTRATSVELDCGGEVIRVLA